jgi:hypothetical protein
MVKNLSTQIERDLRNHDGPPLNPKEFRAYTEKVAPGLWGVIANVATPKKAESEDGMRFIMVMLYMMARFSNQRAASLQNQLGMHLSVYNVSNSNLAVLSNMEVVQNVRTIQIKKKELREKFEYRTQEWVRAAIEQSEALCIGWDEFINVHKYRSPAGSKLSEVAKMVTIVAHRPGHNASVPDPHRPHHNPAGPIDPNLLMAFFRSFEFFAPFPSTLPEATRDQLVVENMLEVVTAYYAEHMEGEPYMQNTVIIDMVEHPFHSSEDFNKLWNQQIMSTELRRYLEKHIAIAPGDYHAQRHARDAIRYKMWKDRNGLAENNPQVPDSKPLPYIDRVIPLNGTLHTALTHAESIYMSSEWLCKGLWQWISPSKKIFNLKPRPWEISLTLTIFYGAWTLIRTPILMKFDGLGQKTLPFTYLYNFLENQCGLQFFWYNYIVKREGNLTNILRGMAQIWLELLIKNRRHYKTSILETICSVLYLDEIEQPPTKQRDGTFTTPTLIPQHPLYTLFKEVCFHLELAQSRSWSHSNFIACTSVSRRV